MKVLADFHHTDLFRALQMLFEKRMGWEVYRPCGEGWYPRYFWHPIEGEALGNLTSHAEFNPAIHKSVLPERSSQKDRVLWRHNARNGLDDGVLFRWMPFDRIKEIDLIVCTIDRNQSAFAQLRRDVGLKCPIVRYTGNSFEKIELDCFDIFLPAFFPDYTRYVSSGLKPGILYHPEFDEIYDYRPMPMLGKPIIRSFLNFIYHHREPGSQWEIWNRYVSYGNEVGALSYLHGVGAPPSCWDYPELNIPFDIAVERSGRIDLKDRSSWPDLRWNRGEAPNHPAVAELMRLSNVMVHPKTTTEGYGFIVHEFAACGRPMIIPDWYKKLAASFFLQDRETCIYITGDDSVDRSNFHWALKPENNERMGDTLQRRFRENVTFEDEARRIRALL